MQVIDFINNKGFKIIKFPDGELHLELDDINRKQSVSIKCRITNSDDLFLLMQLSDILNRQCVNIYQIEIYYLMSMRCDRLFDINRPFTLKIITNVINSFNADIVLLYEPHSSRALEEINNSKCINVTQYLAKSMSRYKKVVPDKGAYERYKELDPVVICSKVRDEATGELLHFSVETKEDVTNQELLVIDDLCDGGGTFLGLAPKLRELKPHSLSLLVTHAVQKEGIKRVASVYDKVYITDSYSHWTNLPNNVIIKPIIQ